MISTFFLPSSRWVEYGTWLKKLDSETLFDYFGLITQDAVIDHQIKKMSLKKEQHHVLIAVKNGQWLGATHIATNFPDVEFGLIVLKEKRQQGIASLMLDECLNFARNRRFKFLYMHCIQKNVAIQQLCNKYNLIPRNLLGDSEVKFKLDSPNFQSYLKELSFRQWKVFQPMLFNA
jgi:GNAT superfamily N-acetyltransferase